MAKIITDGAMLDPVRYGEVAMSRRTKGTPYSKGGADDTGFNLNLNKMPPGLDISNQETAMDVVRIVGIKAIGPIIKDAPNM